MARKQYPATYRVIKDTFMRGKLLKKDRTFKIGLEFPPEEVKVLILTHKVEKVIGKASAK